MRAPRRRSAAATAGPASGPASSVALVHAPVVPERWVSDEERRLEALVLHLSRLDAEHQALSVAVGEFSVRYRERLGEALDALLRAQQVARRLEQLEEDLSAEAARVRSGSSRRSRARSAARPPRTPRDLREPSIPAAEGAPEPGLSLRDLYRSLARRLHPDLTTGDAQRARLSTLMVQVNAAYAAGDRVRLELLASELGSGADGSFTGEARRAQVEARITSLERVVAGVERELRSLRASVAHRRLEDSRQYGERGRDYFHEQLAATKAQKKAVLATITARAHRVEEAVRALNAALPPKGASRVRAFRRSGSDSLRLTAEGRRLGDSLGALAREASWKVAWLAAAFFGEMAGRPPEGLASWDAWADFHEWLRSYLGRVPRFEDAVTALPRGLELGCRVHSGGVRFAVQLRDPEHLAGVAAALSTPPCLAIARDVLGAIGPRLHCTRCRQVTHHVHLHRVRDLDPRHALACTRCGSARRSYRAYGRPEGLEALSGYALALGVVEEQSVGFGGASVRFEMHPRERDELTAERLVKLLRDHLLAGLSPELASRLLCVKSDGTWLRPSARIRRGAEITLSFADGGAPSAARVVSLLRGRRRRSDSLVTAPG